MTPLEPRPLTATVDVEAPPDAVWAVVSDVRRTGEWSPECRRVVPLGTPRVGGSLVGLNRGGMVAWPTLSRVVSLEPGHEIAWQVLTNGAIWTYRLDPIARGTRLTETRHTPGKQSGFASWFTRALLGGQVVHDDELQAGMQSGLQRIKVLAEA